MDFTEIENLRKKYSIPIGICFILLPIDALVLALSPEDAVWTMPCAIGAFVIFGVIAIFGSKFTKLAKEFKKKYMPQIMKQCYPDCKYTADYGVSSDYASKSRVIVLKDRYKSEDLIEGEIDEVKFKTCDIHIEDIQTTSSNGHTTTQYVTTFLGRFFEFEFNKEFKYDLIVKERWVGEASSYGLHSVKLESEQFNKKFKTYAQNDHEAFYILTPQIMERLLEIEKSYKGACSFSFVKNKFYFALNNNKDTFSIDLFKPVGEKTIQQFKDEAKMIKEIIYTLKLNLNIFK